MYQWYHCNWQFWFLFIAEVSFYSPGRDFTCLDGSATIPFNQVNDDYCDCKDGTDEPGKYKQQTVFTHASFERDIENNFMFPLNEWSFSYVEFIFKVQNANAYMVF